MAWLEWLLKSSRSLSYGGDDDEDDASGHFFTVLLDLREDGD